MASSNEVKLPPKRPTDPNDKKVKEFLKKKESNEI